MNTNIFAHNQQSLIRHWRVETRDVWLRYWHGVRLSIIGFSVLLFTGCATSPIPSSPQVRSLSITAVQQNPGAFIGQTVRWGGRIVRVTPRSSRSEIEILAYPLAADGEPQTEQAGQGRFIADSAQFIDPAAYQPDQLLTVVGVITATQTRSIGDYPYTYPIIAMRNHYVWPSEEVAVLLPYEQPSPYIHYWLAPPPPHFRYGPWRPHHWPYRRRGTQVSIGVSGAW